MIRKTEDRADNLRPADAARYLAISLSHLNKLRMKQHLHEGPAFAKVSGCIVYRRADLDAWLERNLVHAAAA